MEWRMQELGLRVTIEVWKERKDDGLYKAWIVGPKGRCLLGTLIPEGTRLCLRRTLSVDSLRRQGVWPVQRVEEELVYSFRERNALVEWEDEVLCCSARNLPRHMVRREGEGFALIFPFDTRGVFPLTPAFCFSRVENGRLIFSFAKGGRPHISPNTGKDKKEI